MGWSFLGFGLFVCFFLTWKRRKTKEKTKKNGKGRKKKISKNMVFCCFCRFWTAKKIFKIFFMLWGGVFWGLGCLSGFVWHGKAGKQKKKRQKMEQKNNKKSQHLFFLMFLLFLGSKKNFWIFFALRGGVFWAFGDVHAFVWKENAGKRKKKGKKMDSTPHCSRVVPHPSTERAQTALTSVFGWEPVHYGWYGRIHICFLAVMP